MFQRHKYDYRSHPTEWGDVKFPAKASPMTVNLASPTIGHLSFSRIRVAELQRLLNRIDIAQIREEAILWGIQC